jgi:hypothetical protein
MAGLRGEGQKSQTIGALNTKILPVTLKNHQPAFIMIKQICFTTVVTLASSSILQASISFTYDSTATYNASNSVLVASPDLDAAARSFIRDPRAALQTFTAPANGYELTGVNIIVNRLFDGATATFSIFDLGTTAPGTDITQTTIDGLTPLATEAVSISGADAAGFGNAVDGWNDALSTLSWTLPAGVTLSPTQVYAFYMDGTDTSNSIVWVRDADNGYSGGVAYYQDTNTGDLSHNVFGGGNASDDWSLALVPEPSTYALLLGFVALGGVLLRRRLRS